MFEITDFRYLGLLAVFILLIGLAYIPTKWPQGKHMTFSQHVAAHRHAIMYYILLFSIVLPLFLLFFLGWFAPLFQLSRWFSVLIVIVSLTQFAGGLVPAVGGWRSSYHWAFASFSAICLVPAMLLIAISSQIDPLDKLLASLGVVAMVSIIGLAAASRGKYRNILALQSLYYVTFFIPVLAISYL